MKQNIFQRISLTAFYVLLLLIALSQQSFAQTSETDKEILVYFLPDSLELKDGLTETTDIKKIKIKSKTLDKAFKKIELKSIKKAFPEFVEADTLKSRKDGKLIKLPNMSRIFALKLKQKDDVDIVIEALLKEKGVLFAEKQMEAKLASDPTFYKQWHLNNTGQTGGTTNADIGAIEAWQIFSGSSSIKIGIFDSGVELNHDDLSGKSYGDNRASIGSEPYQSHGTHVAGIAAAKANNSYGGRGVDWNAQIYSEQIFNGYGSFLGDQNVANKIISAANNGIHILNNSWSSTSFSTTVRMAFAHAYKMNCVVTAAMGNSYQGGNPTVFPAAFAQGILAVGSTTDTDIRSPFSQTGNHIDVVAPGGLNTWENRGEHDIWSTFGTNSYENIAGTSMATPIVTGIASLLKGYNSNLDNDDIENIIKLSADDKGITGWDPSYGTGRVNAKKALNLLQTPNSINQWETTGGSLVGTTNWYDHTFYGASGLTDGTYIVKRRTVEKTVTFPQEFTTVPNVWGRGVESTGYSTENSNFGMGFCEVVPGTVTRTSAKIRTYIYDIYMEDPYDGWPDYWKTIPTSAQDVDFAYSVLGDIYEAPTTPSISMSGGWGDNPTLTFSGGGPNIDYYVLKKEYDYGSGFNASYVNPASNPYTDYNVEIVRFGGDVTARYSVKVVDVLGNSSSYSNTVLTDGQTLWKNNNDKKSEEIITEYSLESNYPNPFNPSTTINYQIPKNGFVNLTVYNSLGQVVNTLVNKQQTVGKYTVQFNASNLPSGIYIYKLQAGEFSSTKKMVLAK